MCVYVVIREYDNHYNKPAKVEGVFVTFDSACRYVEEMVDVDFYVSKQPPFEGDDPSVKVWWMCPRGDISVHKVDMET